MGRFSELTGGFSRSAAELIHQDATSYDPRSKDKMANRPFMVQNPNYDRESAPKDEMKKYWRQYETTPIVRKPINAFANRVIEPGYYLEHEDLSEEDRKEVMHWLESCAIVEGEIGKDIRKMLKKSMIQRDVRGTATIEKVKAKEDRDKIAGLKLINPETIEVNTRPGQAVLLDPDDHEIYENAPKTPEGKAAAYMQDLSETGHARWGITDKAHRRHRSSWIDENRIGFSRDEIIKLTRDADVGEVFGTSRIEAVSDRITGLKQKLNDNDEAIASKAYPLWLFKFGSEENPWGSDDIEKFMKNHEMENFHPGMKQGVRGDVNVDTVSGEVAQIFEYLQFDVDWVLSVMPMARDALGGFAGGAAGAGAEVGAASQEVDLVRQMKEARREIESEFTPLIREKAKELGVPEEIAEHIDFKIGDPDRDEEIPTNIQQIDYRGVGDDVDDSPEEEDIPEGDSPNSDEDSPQVTPLKDDDIPEYEPEENSVWTEPGVAELSTERDNELGELIADKLIEFRENVLDSVEKNYGSSSTHAAYNFSKVANRKLRHTFRARQFERSVEPYIEEAVRDAMSETPSGSQYSMQVKQNTRLFTTDLQSAVYEAMEDLAARMRVQLSRAASDGDSFKNASERIKKEFNDNQITFRANMIAYMELQNAKESTKLHEFERDPDVIGVEVYNADPNTDLSEELHGAQAFFAEGDIGKQLRAQVSEDNLYKGFDPLPVAPPYHFGDTTELRPLMEE